MLERWILMWAWMHRAKLCSTEVIERTLCIATGYMILTMIDHIVECSDDSWYIAIHITFCIEFWSVEDHVSYRISLF